MSRIATIDSFALDEPRSPTGRTVNVVASASALWDPDMVTGLPHRSWTDATFLVSSSSRRANSL